MTWDDEREAAEHLEAARAGLAFDIDLLRDYMRALSANVEHLSILTDLTPTRAAVVARDVERSAHLVDDLLRVHIIPVVASALRLGVQPW